MGLTAKRMPKFEIGVVSSSSDSSMGSAAVDEYEARRSPAVFFATSDILASVVLNIAEFIIDSNFPASFFEFLKEAGNVALNEAVTFIPDWSVIESQTMMESIPI